MSIFYLFKTNRTVLKLLYICEQFIDMYEVKDVLVPSCKKDLLESIDHKIRSDIDHYAHLEASVLEKTAHELIAQEAFDLLTSGKYHIYTGILNQASCGENLLKVYKSNMKDSIKSGEITAEAGDAKCNDLIKYVTGGETTWQTKI